MFRAAALGLLLDIKALVDESHGIDLCFLPLVTPPPAVYNRIQLFLGC